MLDQNTMDNQAKLREEISEIKQYLSLIEHEINSSGRVGQLSDRQFQDIWKRLRVVCNFTYNVNYFWGKYTNDREFKKKLAEADLEETARVAGKEVKQ